MSPTVRVEAVRSARKLSRAEAVCLAGFAALTVLWIMLPVIPQDPGYHNFADQRSFLGLPRAADVLSNIAFLLVGASGIGLLLARNRRHFLPAAEAGLWCVAIGVVCTALCSAWYHRSPNDATLVWDRLPMTLAFAGVFGIAVAQRIGGNAGTASLVVLVPIGFASIAYWQSTGDLSLYGVMQFGGSALLLLVLVLTARGDDPFPWWWVIAFYGLAKVAEAADLAIWNASGHWIAGHALKHLLAALASGALFVPLRARLQRCESAQNA